MSPSTAAPERGTVVTAEPDGAAFAAKGWVVVVWNDPINLMTYVTWVLRSLFGYSHAKAHALMLQVHHEGRAAVAHGNRERCEYDAARLHAHGLWATITEA